ncbi:MAG: hypothetical protein JXQ73_20585 [Phycisphaerae bacterium]|nr:hypothetical protein [Phycisphaerae bacterium]
MSDTDEAKPMDDVADQTPAGDEIDDFEEPQRKIGWKKGLVIVVAVLTLFAFLDTYRRHAYRISWSHDFEACMAQAQNPRKAVILLIHKRNDSRIAIMDDDVFSDKGVYDWATQGVPCRLIWEEHPELVRKYKLTESPSLLCLNPEGKAIFEWSGDSITPAVRKRQLPYVVGKADEGSYRRPNAIDRAP